MYFLFSSLIKLTTIFIGSGLIALFAFWVGKQTSTIPKLIFDLEQKKTKNQKINLKKNQKISTQSGLYEVLFPSGESLKLFSSHKGMKLMD